MRLAIMSYAKMSPLPQSYMKGNHIDRIVLTLVHNHLHATRTIFEECLMEQFLYMCEPDCLTCMSQ